MYDEEFFDLHEVSQERQATVYADFLRNFIDFTHSWYNIPKCSALAVGKSLFAKMSDSSLHFHTPVRILAIFSWAKNYEIRLTPTEILAIWFHNSIHRIGAKHGCNEYSSAQFATALMSQWVRDTVMLMVQAGIEDTRRCFDDAPLKNAKIIDMTLIPFAWSIKSRKEVNKALTKELSRLYCIDKINEMRKCVLEKLLDRSPFFHTPKFSQKFHWTAINNIRNELRNLNGINIRRSEAEAQAPS